MHKSFTIKDAKFKAISKRKGAIYFYLIDEFNEKRTVSAIAKLNWDKKITSVEAVYKRETPLVEALAKASINDKIEVDFVGFNKRHPRVTNGHLITASRGFPKTIDLAIEQVDVEYESSLAINKPQFIMIVLSFLLLLVLVKLFLL